MSLNVSEQDHDCIHLFGDVSWIHRDLDLFHLDMRSLFCWRLLGECETTRSVAFSSFRFEEVHVVLLFYEAILFLVNCYKVKLWLHFQRRLLVYICILKSIHYVEVCFCIPSRLRWQEGCVLISWRKPAFLWPVTCSFVLVRDCFLLVWKPLKAYLNLVL